MPPKRTQFSLSEKASLRAYHEQHPHLTQPALAEWFEAHTGKPIRPNSVSEILSSRYTSLDSDQTKRPKLLKQRRAAYPVLERILSDWVYRQEQHLVISSDLIKGKARSFWPRIPEYNEIPIPDFSDGWVGKFKARHGLRYRPRHGEAGSAAELPNMAADLAIIQAKVAQFAPTDQYNCDETGLFWKMVPDRGISSRTLPGVKKEKARITIHHACNATGSHKLPMWVIGKHKRPRAFRAAGVKDVEALGIKWRYNKKAWMTTEIMVDWLRWFDQQMSGRKVLLLMDNFSAHLAAINSLEAMPQGLGLLNTEVLFLPPNTTSKLQPLDQGIVASFKARYRRSWIRFMLEQHELGHNPLQTMNVLKAIQFSITAWDEVSSTTISNCWAHSKVNLNPVQMAVDTASQQVIESIQGDLQQLYIQHQIQQAMDINQLINPPDEQVIDADNEIDEELLALHCPVAVEEPESDTEVLEELPIVTPKQVLELLQSIKLGEIQSDDCNAESIRWLERYEKIIKERHLKGLKQAGIRSYFNTGEARD
jgi:hypothetical protein